MKKIIVLLITGIALTGIAHADTLANWDFDDHADTIYDDDTQDNQDLTTYAVGGYTLATANVRHSDNTKLRDGASSDDVMIAIGWNDATNLATAITVGNYYKITFAPAADEIMNLTQLALLVSGYGPDSDLNEEATAVLTDSSNNLLDSTTLASPNATAYGSLTADLTGGAFDGLTNAEFRLYFYSSGTTELVYSDKFGIGNVSQVDAASDIDLQGTLGLGAQRGTLYEMK